jgi:hypothetical protein
MTQQIHVTVYYYFQLLKFSAKCDIMPSIQNLVSKERCFKLSQVIMHDIS